MIRNHRIRNLQSAIRTRPLELDFRPSSIVREIERRTIPCSVSQINSIAKNWCYRCVFFG